VFALLGNESALINVIVYLLIRKSRVAVLFAVVLLLLLPLLRLALRPLFE
jgi:hypothetical protein